ncbi:MBL fold metallo-hydrolase [soil metagenome]
MAAFGFETVTGGVYRLRIVFVNAYAVEVQGGWVLVDTGPPGFGPLVALAAMKQFGDVPPKAIVLTHAHFDHSGNAKALADEWDVPIYVFEQELPYVTKRSDYAPQDPTPGGAICFLSRVFPTHGIDLGDRVRVLHEGEMPLMPGWTVIHTPGHTQGHVSLFREGDRTLLAGDAFATADTDNWIDVLGWSKRLSRPPTPFTPDWESTCASVEKLVALRPAIAAAGHGYPLTGGDLPSALAAFEREMAPPPKGRYTDHPAEYAPDGSLAEVPPPAPDPLPKKLAVAGIVAVIGFIVVKAVSGRRK